MAGNSAGAPSAKPVAHRFSHYRLAISPARSSARYEAARTHAIPDAPLHIAMEAYATPFSAGLRLRLWGGNLREYALSCAPIHSLILFDSLYLI